jgi:hypothetical protein
LILVALGFWMHPVLLAFFCMPLMSLDERIYLRCPGDRGTAYPLRLNHWPSPATALAGALETSAFGH